MKRLITREINEWYQSGTSVPLLIMGPRGVGKTSTVNDFASSLKEGSLYVNFETDSFARNYFDKASETDPESLILAFFQATENNRFDNIVIFDEIQASASFCRLINAVNTPLKIKIIGISSYIQKSFTEAFKCIYMAPLRFDEYLSAIGREWYSEIVLGHFEKKRPVPQLVHNEILALFSDYLHIGGMPAVVNEFASDDESVCIPGKRREQYNNILSDISLYGKAKGLRDIIDAAALHTSLGRRRFTFNLIRRGATYNMYRDAIEELLFNRVLFKSEKTDDPDSFRLTFFDTGITCYLLTGLYLLDDTFVERQIVLTGLIASLGAEHDIFYYEDGQTSKADLLYSGADGIIPVDLADFKGRQIKSINKYVREHKAAYIVSLGDENYKLENSIQKIPVYSGFLLQ